jgi:hypothetical protein
MLRAHKSVALALVAMTAWLNAEDNSNDIDAFVRSQTYDKYLVILCAEREFSAAKQEAERVSGLANVSFSMNGKIWDSNRGLILPDNCQDPIYCGEYLPRRYNELDLTAADPVGYISVEKSEAYPGLPKGKYIAVAAISNSNDEAEKELLKFKPFASKAYVAKTEIYMGCIH